MNYRQLFTILILILVTTGIAQATIIPKDLSSKYNLKIERKDYPNANEVFLSDLTEIEVEANGDNVEKSASLYKILTPDAVKRNQTLTFDYNSRYQKIEYLRIKLIYPDGKIKEFQPEEFKDGTLPELQEMNIYESSFRQKSLSLGDIPVGSMIEIYKTLATKGMIRNHYCDRWFLQSTEPVLNSELSLTVPAKMNLKTYCNNDSIKESVTKTQDKTTYYWQATNMPQIIYEHNMPYSSIVANVYVTTFSNWKEASNYVYNLNKNKYKMTDKMKKTVDELTKDCKNDKEKILAVQRYIAKKIRYMGSSMDVSSYIEAHDAAYTFEKGYGVCRDKALLMTAMLRYLNIEASDLLINPGAGVETNPKVPTFYFTHAVVLVTYDGVKYVMDPTDEQSRELGSDYAGDRYVLPLVKDGADLFKLPAVQPSQNGGHIVTSATLSADGKLSMEASINGVGGYEKYLRTYGRYLSGERFKKLFESLSGTTAAGSVISDFKAADPENMQTPYSIQFKLSAENYGLNTDQFYLVPFPSRSLNFDMVTYPTLLSVTTLAERKYPIVFNEPFASTIEESITIPAGYKIKALPENLSIKSDAFTVEYQFSKDGNIARFIGKYSINKRHIDVEEYRQLKQTAETMKKRAAQYIILEKI